MSEVAYLKSMDFYTYYERNLLKQSIDFKYATSLIKSYLSCSKLKPVLSLGCQPGAKVKTEAEGSKNTDTPMMILSRAESRIQSSRKTFVSDESKAPPSEKSDKLRKSNSYERKKFFHKTLQGLVSPKFLNFGSRECYSEVKTEVGDSHEKVRAEK